MDKWDQIVDRIQKGILAEEPEAAMTGALQLLAEFGRTADRIANCLERVEISGDTEYPAELDLNEFELEHDL